MKKSEFLKQLKLKNDSRILYLCIEHMLDKIYEDDLNFEENEIKEFFSNYKNYHIYLNDFAGTIYNKYGSHVNSIYIDMCEYLDIQVDNKYTLNHVITKLEKQTPGLLLGLTNEDIQKQTVIHFDEKLKDIEGSYYYKAHKEEFIQRVEKLYENIKIVKNALNF